MEKGTMTGLALKHMVENSFSEAEGARPASRNIPRIGLVFTDGRSQDDITEFAKKAKEAGKNQLVWGPNCIYRLCPWSTWWWSNDLIPAPVGQCWR